MRRASSALLLLAALTGCKGNLFYDVGLEKVAAPEMLGVVLTPDRDPPHVDGVTTWSRTDDGPGVVVQRVLKDSPAEAAGLRPGDLLLRFGSRTLHAPVDLHAAKIAIMSERRYRSDKVELTVVRQGVEHVIPIVPQESSYYQSQATARLDEAIRLASSSISVPFLWTYQRVVLPVEPYLAYSGRLLREPLVLYRDFDIIPILDTFSLFRVESTPGGGGAWRLQTLTWPLTFDGRSDGLTYRAEALAEGEERYAVY